MIQQILFLAFTFQSSSIYVNAALYDYEQPSRRSAPSADMEFEPITTLSKDKENILTGKNINCEDFTRYALNCNMEAAMQYNSSRNAPPMPAKVGDWCKAVRQLTNCAIDWNSECREVTESHFNEESIRGHMHVISYICDDEWFLTRYDDIPICIEATADVWEACYATFKLIVDLQKNKSQEWTHYESHFYMCCARAQFRRCTLDSVFGVKMCTPDQASTLQKFSVVISEGDVFQDCDSNLMYSNCPGGDPRPSQKHLNRLMNSDRARSTSQKLRTKLHDIFCIFILYYGLYYYCV